MRNLIQERVVAMIGRGMSYRGRLFNMASRLIESEAVRKSTKQTVKSL